MAIIREHLAANGLGLHNHEGEKSDDEAHDWDTVKRGLQPASKLLEAEKSLTRRSDELARRRQELPSIRIDKEYRFEIDEESSSLADLLLAAEPWRLLKYFRHGQSRRSMKLGARCSLPQ
jgi:hypothetical protein